MTTAQITDPDLDEEFYSDESAAERSARLETTVALDPLSQTHVDQVLDKLMMVCDELSGHPLYGYQTPFARRIFESLIINDGATLTACFSRQAGKSECVANVVTTAMIMFPILARIFPELMGKFKEGVWVGAFAPVEDQADNLFGRIVARLTSERAQEILADPEIDDSVGGKRKELFLKKNGSLVRKQTCHPRATIEGRTYHLILVDECQGADEKVINKGLAPMGTATNATMVFTGTPTYEKGAFYKQIQQNKRNGTKRNARTNHFEADWKIAARWNKNYGLFVKKELLRIGEDSDEFKLSYRLIWLLDRGMFSTSDRLDELGDVSMQVVHSHHRSPIVIGIDPARKTDSTIVTAVWVGWENPDEFGYYDHRILNWLDLQGLPWEEQYFRIVEFCANYNVFAIGVDSGGVGDVVASRLRVLMPHLEIVDLGSQRPDQSTRWKHLMELMDRGKIGWPAHAKTRRLKTYRRFRQQMEDLEKNFEGPYVLAAAPREADAHDDYCVLSSAPIVVKSKGIQVAKPIGNVLRGDQVLTGEGRWRNVLATSTHSPTGSKVTIKPWGNSALVVTGNHPVLTDNGFVRADELTLSSKVLYRINRQEHGVTEIDLYPYFTQTEVKNAAKISLGGTEESEGKIRYRNPKARWLNRFIKVNDELTELLGWYAAEGSCGKHNVQFTLNAKEITELDRIEYLFSSIFGIDGMSRSSRPGATTLTISSVALRAFFQDLLPGTASQKILPTLITEAPVYLQQAFLAAFWAGDGCFTDKNVCLSTTSLTLAAQVRDMLLRQGIVATMATSRRAGRTEIIRGREVRHNHDLHLVRVAQPESVNLMAEILGKSGRKGPGVLTKRSATIEGDYLCSSLRSLEVGSWSPDEKVSNLTVEGDHTYSLPMMTTHNCDSLALACVLTRDYTMPTVQVSESPFFSRGR